ncbi:MBL fold metallo-hydrolase [Neobacillus mesonae]|nr:MBL fold metallo-hydrolase [Neobacillus mesonae]
MSEELKYGNDYKSIPATSVNNRVGVEAAEDLYCYTDQIVNIVMIGQPESKKFVLVDAGLPGSAQEIINVAEERFGENCRPSAILLTHGHFDHVGSIIELIEHWGVTVYAHPMEFPYLTGQQSYPEPDPTVEGGVLAKISSYFPNEPIQLGRYIKELPADGTVPYLDGFRWVHTPGHAPGHVSFFRMQDRALIAGDAFVTVRQDSLYKVLTQKQEITGPPRYFTTDWSAAKLSVKKLLELQPEVTITGHGSPVSGEELAHGLERLVSEFDSLALPDHGRYVN